MIILVLAVFGLILGSFVNAFVWRLHEGRLASMVRGRSMCTHCKHELAAKDLIPVVSWLWLRGRCRYCKAKIQDSPLVEVATGVLFAVSYAFWPLALHGVGLFTFVVWLLFVVAFVALAVYDLRWFLLPNVVVFPLIGAAALEVIIVAVWQQNIWVAVDAALGALVLSGIFYGLFQVSGGNWIGGGDVKLALVLGLLAGTPAKALLLLFIASLIGTIVGLPLSLQSNKGLKLKVPFGPFLLLATVIVVLFGASMINWYTTASIFQSNNEPEASTN